MAGTEPHKRPKPKRKLIDLIRDDGPQDELPASLTATASSSADDAGLYLSSDLDDARGQADEDFMSDSFLVEPESFIKTGRPSAQRRGKAASNDGQTKKAKLSESQARAQGLAQSLFERSDGRTAEEGLTRCASFDKAEESKSLRMMRLMGYEPGQTLGLQHDKDNNMDPIDKTADPKGAEPADPSKESKARSALLEPLPMDLSRLPESHGGRSFDSSRKRAGIGAAVSRSIQRACQEQAEEAAARTRRQNEAQDQQLADFRIASSLRAAEARAEKHLTAAKRVCRDLDGRVGLEFSPLWLEASWFDKRPDGAHIELDRAGARLGESYEDRLVRLALEDDDEQVHEDLTHCQVSSESSMGATEAESHSEQQQPGSSSTGCASPILPFGPRDVLSTPTQPAEEVSSRSGTASASPGQIIQQPPSRRQEARDFLLLPVAKQLSLVLNHLRTEHAYCLWCGMAYADGEEMTTLCPGEDEEDH